MQCALEVRNPHDKLSIYLHALVTQLVITLFNLKFS